MCCTRACVCLCSAHSAAVVSRIYVKAKGVLKMRNYISRLCECEIKGGRVVETQAGKVSVYDIDKWEEEMSHCVRARFPGTSISYVECKASRSGFRVDCVAPASQGGSSFLWSNGGCLLFFSLFLLYGLSSVLILPADMRGSFTFSK